ncbi:MAG TPA: hypothetical protein VIM65_11325 [Cyclobacteriaceae bacterium]
MKDYKFSTKHGAPIDPNDAKRWIDKYKTKHTNEVHAYFFGSEIIRKILDHPEAVGMRIYFGYGDEDKKQVVLIGSREDGSNIWPDGVEKGSGGSGGTVADSGAPCPPYC